MKPSISNMILFCVLSLWLLSNCKGEERAEGKIIKDSVEINSSMDEQPITSEYVFYDYNSEPMPSATQIIPTNNDKELIVKITSTRLDDSLIIVDENGNLFPYKVTISVSEDGFLRFKKMLSKTPFEAAFDQSGLKDCMDWFKSPIDGKDIQIAFYGRPEFFRFIPKHGAFIFQQICCPTKGDQNCTSFFYTFDQSGNMHFLGESMYINISDNQDYILTDYILYRLTNNTKFNFNKPFPMCTEFINDSTFIVIYKWYRADSSDSTVIYTLAVDDSSDNAIIYSVKGQKYLSFRFSGFQKGADSEETLVQSDHSGPVILFDYTAGKVTIIKRDNFLKPSIYLLSNIPKLESKYSNNDLFEVRFYLTRFGLDYYFYIDVNSNIIGYYMKN